MNHLPDQSKKKIAIPRMLLENYELNKQLGQGAYGIVWQGTHRKTKQNVAIKCFSDLWRDHVDAKRVLREVCILRRIQDHSNIVKLHDIICPDDITNFKDLFIVLELGAIDLKAYLKAHIENDKTLNLNQVRNILSGILLGLKHCQEIGVLHRDLKPANVLLFADNLVESVKLCDFGLSREINSYREILGHSRVPTCEMSRISKTNNRKASFGKETRCHKPQTSYSGSICSNAQNAELSLNKKSLLKPRLKESSNVMSIEKKTIVPQKVNLLSVHRGSKSKENLAADTLRSLPSTRRKTPNNRPLLSSNQSTSGPSISVSGSAIQLTRGREELRGEKKRLKRKLTRHIVTRWYRSPEIILMQEYDFKSDVWSAGCIFAELLGATSLEGYRGPLFPGKSCYPMSPVFQPHSDIKTKPKVMLDVNDQLNIIFNVMGTPEKVEDLSFIKNPQAKSYCENYFARPMIKFGYQFPGANEDALNLLANMLCFNPQKRLSIDECLEHPFLQNREQAAPERASCRDKSTYPPIKLDFEHDELHLCTEDLKALFLREVQHFHVVPKFEETYGNLIKEIEAVGKYGTSFVAQSLQRTGGK